MTLLKKALLRPKRYAGLALEAMVCIFNAPERVEDEVAHVLSLPVGDAVELETICFLEDGHAVNVPLFACGEVADWLDRKLPLESEPQRGWHIRGRWLFGITYEEVCFGNGNVSTMPVSHFGLLVEDIPEHGPF